VYRLSLRGLALKHRFTPSDFREALVVLRQAVELDPLYAPAWNYLGQLVAADALFEFNGPANAWCFWP
jgi:hypothetical protein